jgi:methyl-accepting chemotaxis protein
MSTRSRSSGPSLGRRLLSVSAATLCIALAGSAYGIWSLNKVAAQTQELIDGSVVTERLVGDWYRNVVAAVKRTTAIAVSADPALTEFFAKDTADVARSTSGLIEKITPLMASEEEKRLFQEITSARKGYTETRDKVAALKKEGQAEAARKLLDEQYLPRAAAYQDALQKLSAMQRKQIDDAGAEIQALNRSAQLALVAFGTLALLLGGVLSLWLARSITRPIQRAASVADRIAGFDLSERIESHDRDETGRLLRSLAAMQASLRTLVREVRASSGSINVASSEIAAGNSDLSSRTEQAASNLQETAASIEQMNTAVQQSAANARTANELAATAAEVATKGGGVIDQVVATMAEINGSSRKIADITGVIDGIAFQTNILALNAAVEAARAGEQGRGFAVVASEVRTLAQRSAVAAKEIKELVGRSVESVDAGSQMVAAAGQTMHEIVGSVQRVSAMVHEISVAAGEQSQGIGQVNAAVVQLDQVTQQNAALVEESAAAAGSLQRQAGQLVAAVDRFNLGRDDEDAALRATPPVAGAAALPRAATAPAANAPIVHRPNFQRPAATPPAPSAARTGTDDDWQSF